jgi:hypothetical protein
MRPGCPTLHRAAHYGPVHFRPFLSGPVFCGYSPGVQFRVSEAQTGRATAGSAISLRRGYPGAARRRPTCTCGFTAAYRNLAPTQMAPVLLPLRGELDIQETPKANYAGRDERECTVGGNLFCETTKRIHHVTADCRRRQ